jgi:GNAT superfamily N-acetyltransferase
MINLIDKKEILSSTEDDNEFIHNHLREYNRQFMADFKDYNYHIEEKGKIIAGIVAESIFDSLDIEFHFVDEKHRDEGLGTKLLKHVEDIAKANNLKRILINTYSFQAPEFYKQHGYKAVGSYNPCFGEFEQFFLKKELN